MRKKILLMAGHGDGDPGAIGSGYRESDLTRDFVNLMIPTLNYYTDVTVFDTSKNPYKHLKANKYDFKKYDYVFEVHFNAAANDVNGDGNTTGCEMLVHTTENGVSVEEGILKKISAFGFKNRGVKRVNNLHNMNMCKGKQGVSYALLEVCFIDDKDDMDIYIANQGKIAKAVTHAIGEGFGAMTVKEEYNMNRFSDIAGHYAEDEINELYDMGIVKGDGGGRFRPNENIKRADAAIMIRNAIRYITGK